MNKIANRIKNLVTAIPKIVTKEQAYEFGRDCGINGANNINSHYSIFFSNENTKAWERGKRDGENSNDDWLDKFVH